MKSKFFYVLGLTVFAAWLGLSTPVISHLSGEDKLKEISFDDLSNKDTVYWEIETESLSYNLLEISGFRGYAFVETEAESPNRTVSLIFRGGGVCYEVPASLYKRGGSVRKQFPSKRVPQSNYLGYSVDFSTLRMKEGVYDLYFYCWENETNYGVVDTGYQVEKRDSTLVRYPAKGEKVNTLPTPTQEEKFSVAIDKAQVAEGVFSINGWAVIPEQDCSFRNLYIELTDECGEITRYLARSGTRLDVSEGLKDSRYENSGYMMSLPADEFPDGSWRMRLLIENREGVWESLPYGLIKTGEFIDVRSYVWGGYKLHTPLIVSKASANLTAIDQLRIDEETLILSGWAAVPGEDSASQSVYVSLTDRQGEVVQYTTRSETRQDVADNLSDSKMLHTGYAINLPVNEIEDGLWEMQILVEKDREVWGSEVYRLKKTEKNVSILWDSEKLRSRLFPSQTAKLDIAIDEVLQMDDSITVRGWAVVPGLDCSTQKVYVELMDGSGKAAQYTAHSVIRLDVSSGTDNPLYANSGYALTVPADSISDGNLKIKLLIENNGEIWESHTYNFEKNGEQIVPQS